MTSGRPHALLSWESGGGTGHVSEMRVVGEALAARGWTLSCMARYPVAVWRRMGAHLGQIHQAPALRPLEDTGISLRQPSVDFADILAFTGFANEATLECQLRQLDSVLAAVDPDLVVADFAPVTCLATRGRIPTIRIGSSFYLPPAGIREFPRLRQEGRNLVDPRRTLRVVRSVCRKLGLSQPSTLPGAIGADADVVTCHPGFDIYSKLRAEAAHGPLKAFPDILPAPGSSDIFFYLSGEYQPNERVLESLAGAGVALRGHLRGPTDKQREICKRARIEFSETPLDIQLEMRRANTVIHNGGINLMQEVAAAGRYQIVFPRHLEQQLNARRLRALGLGMAISPRLEPEAMGKCLREAMDRHPGQADIEERARSLRHPAESLSRLLGTVDRLAGI